MKVRDLYRDFALRPVEAAGYLPALTHQQLNTSLMGHPNTIAWLLWHAGREVDMQLAELTGAEEVWRAEGFRERFDLGPIGDTMGYGHTPAEAALIVVNSQQLLVEYLTAALNACVAYADQLEEGEWDEIVDRSWEVPVTRGVRLVSLVDDAAQHVGQAAYVAGALTA
ncbi:DUF664 domain-containing protein [Corynebacterium canis]|uniref:DUF664 domain-containing protein n=1 Tax=Corynebacterium canis TaxID=679663 RepID=A0A5C5TZ23_9CORY|nr:DUF664 domain-containing protein [Corynebacterium canis]TWT19016.1 DUF664 domain-containing protein [Corynebacterium canis]WJY73903.1 DinB superfamily protein [Corynebacterium canis]